MKECNPTEDNGVTAIYIRGYDITKYYTMSDLKKDADGKYILKRKYGKFTRSYKDAKLNDGPWYKLKFSEHNRDLPTITYF